MTSVYLYQLQTDSDAADGSFPKIPEVLFPTLKYNTFGIILHQFTCSILTILTFTDTGQTQLSVDPNGLLSSLSISLNELIKVLLKALKQELFACDLGLLGVTSL